MLQLLRDLQWKLNCFKIGLVDTMFLLLVTLKKIINIMVNFQGYTKEFNKYIRESGYLSLVS